MFLPTDFRCRRHRFLDACLIYAGMAFTRASSRRGAGAAIDRCHLKAYAVRHRRSNTSRLVLDFRFEM